MHLRAVTLCPAPNRGVIIGQTAFRHEFFHVPEAQAESEIPAHAGDDHLGLELALPEQRWSTRLHPVNLPDPQMQHFPPRRCRYLGNSRIRAELLGVSTCSPA